MKNLMKYLEPKFSRIFTTLVAMPRSTYD